MTSKENKATEKGLAEMQATFDAEHEQGFRGTKVDPTPNAAYTVAGVTAGDATPETDEAAAKEAKDASADLASQGDPGKDEAAKE